MLRSRAVRRLVVWPVLAIGLTFALAGCVETASEPSATASPSLTVVATGDGVLRIGNLAPTSGASAFLGAAQVDGVNLAVADINAAGGFGGKPVEVINADSADASSTTLETSFASLVAAKVAVIIGPNSSVLAVRAVPLAAQAGVPLISPAATFPRLTGGAHTGYFFRTIPNYAYQGTVLGGYVSAAKPVKVALVYLDDELGQSLEPALLASLAASGSSLVAVPFTAKDTDFAAQLKDVADAKPDLVVLSAPFDAIEQSKTLIAGLTTAGFGAGKLWLTSQTAADYSQALPSGLLAGVNAIIDGFHPDAAFVARLIQLDPALSETRYAAEAYDATTLAALAAVVARDASGAAIARNLEDISKGGIKCGSFAECMDVLKTNPNIDYDGITGPVNFTAAGDVVPASFGVYAYDSENRFVYKTMATGR